MRRSLRLRDRGLEFNPNHYHMDPTFLSGSASVVKVQDLNIKVTHFTCFNAGMKGIVNRLNDMTD